MPLLGSRILPLFRERLIRSVASVASHVEGLASPNSPVRLLRRLSERWRKHRNTTASAAIAFYGLFTLAAVLVVAAAAIRAVVPAERLGALLGERLTDALGDIAADIARDALLNDDVAGGHWAYRLVVVTVMVFWGSGAIVQLQMSLETIFERERGGGPREWAAMAANRLVAVGAVFAGGLGLLAILFANVFLWRMLGADESPLAYGTFRILEESISAAVVLAIFASLLLLLPSRRPPLRFVLAGAGLAAGLFQFGKWLFGIYVEASVVATTFGKAAAVIGFVAWVYYSTQALLLGAEFAATVAEDRRRRAEREKKWTNRVRRWFGVGPA